MKNKRGRHFKLGIWQDIFIRGIEKSNSYCCFAFTHHHISIANKRTSRFTFSASARCIFKDCSVKVLISIDDCTRVNLNYSGSVKHRIGEVHARHITGCRRNKLAKDFKCGIKPLTKYLNIFSKCNDDQLKSGNADSLGGKNTVVFRKIASQSRQTRFDQNEIKSLLLMKQEMIAGGKEFIRKICVDPLYVLYWSEEGLKIYHKLGIHYPISWDATGSVVRSISEGKMMLYYEIAIKNPISGEMGPVTADLRSITADSY